MKDEDLDKIIIVNGQIQSKAQLASMFDFKNEFSPLLQKLLVFCMNEMTAIPRTSKLPKCLAEYVIKGLPESFLGRPDISNKQFALK